MCSRCKDFYAKSRSDMNYNNGIVYYTTFKELFYYKFLRYQKSWMLNLTAYNNVRGFKLGRERCIFKDDKKS
jgi:hypothetical protein